MIRISNKNNLFWKKCTQISSFYNLCCCHGDVSDVVDLLVVEHC